MYSGGLVHIIPVNFQKILFLTLEIVYNIKVYNYADVFIPIYLEYTTVLSGQILNVSNS